MDAHPVSALGLRLSIATTEDSVVVKCSGRLTAEVTQLLKDEVKPLIGQPKCIVLDLTDLKRMDSAGLGTIVGLLVSARTHGSDLRLINLNKQVRDLLGITNVLAAFEDCGRFLTKIP